MISYPVFSNFRVKQNERLSVEKVGVGIGGYAWRKVGKNYPGTLS